MGFSGIGHVRVMGCAGIAGYGRVAWPRKLGGQARRPRPRRGQGLHCAPGARDGRPISNVSLRWRRHDTRRSASGAVAAHLEEMTAAAPGSRSVGRVMLGGAPSVRTGGLPGHGHSAHGTVLQRVAMSGCGGARGFGIAVTSRESPAPRPLV